MTQMNIKSQFDHSRISIGDITASAGAGAANKMLGSSKPLNSEVKRSSLPDIKPINMDLLLVKNGNKDLGKQKGLQRCGKQEGRGVR